MFNKNLKACRGDYMSKWQKKVNKYIHEYNLKDGSNIDGYGAFYPRTGFEQMNLNSFKNYLADFIAFLPYANAIKCGEEIDFINAQIKGVRFENIEQVKNFIEME